VHTPIGKPDPIEKGRLTHTCSGADNDLTLQPERYGVLGRAVEILF
jgi:hypothetical protein